MVALTQRVCFLFLQNSWFSGTPVLMLSVLAACSSGWFPGLLETGQCYLNSERFTVLLCCQLPTDFHNISIVKGVSASGVGSSRTIYGTDCSASNHALSLSEKSGYLWCTFVSVPYTAKCIGEWAGRYNRVDCVELSVSPVTPINYCRNSPEGVWWPWYIGSDLGCKEDFWEASSLGF